LKFRPTSFGSNCRRIIGLLVHHYSSSACSSGLFCARPALCWNCSHLCDSRHRIQPKYFCKVEELDDIEPALPALDICDEWLAATQGPGYRRLSHADAAPLFDKHLDETRVARRMYRRGHRRRFAVEPAIPLIRFPYYLKIGYYWAYDGAR
jgi:hypothetical protein